MNAGLIPDISNGATMATGQKRLAYIDGFRGLAAVAVVLFHIWNRYYPNMATGSYPADLSGSHSLAFYLTFGTIQYGYLGVTVFFVLSGYCIHMPYARKYWRDDDRSFSLVEFGGRRFRRLYPAYFGSLVLTSLLAGFFPLLNHLSKHQPIPWLEVLQVRYFALNALFLQQFDSTSLTNFNGVYWTLLYEAQFYLLYPALLWATRRFGATSIIAVLLPVQSMLTLSPVAIPSFGPQRLYEWYLGVLGCELVFSGKAVGRQILLSTVGVAFCGIGIASTFIPAIFPFRDLLFATGFLGVLLWAVDEHAEAEEGRKGWLLSLVEQRAVVLAGLFSYSLYLVHVPIIDVFALGGELLVKRGLIGDLAARWLLTLSIPASFVVAWCFYQVLEAPFLAKRVKNPAEPPLSPAMNPFEFEVKPSGTLVQARTGRRFWLARR